MCLCMYVCFFVWICVFRECLHVWSSCLRVCNVCGSMSHVCMCTFVLKTATVQTFVISVSSPRVIVWSVVYKRTENVRYASDFSKNSECKYKQTKNTQAQQNWQSFIKMTQNWTASSETTWNNLSRKHIHIWKLPANTRGGKFCLRQVTRRPNSCNRSSSPESLGDREKQHIQCFSPESSGMIGAEHEQKQTKTPELHGPTHSQPFIKTGERPGQILKHRSRAANDDTILTHGLNCYSSFHREERKQENHKPANLRRHSHLNGVFSHPNPKCLPASVTFRTNKPKERLLALILLQLQPGWSLKTNLSLYCGNPLLSLQAEACHLNVRYQMQPGFFAHFRKSSIFMWSRRWYSFCLQSCRQIMSRYDWAGLHSYPKLKCASSTQSEINLLSPVPKSRLQCALLRLKVLKVL